MNLKITEKDLLRVKSLVESIDKSVNVKSQIVRFLKRMIIPSVLFVLSGALIFWVIYYLTKIPLTRYKIELWVYVDILLFYFIMIVIIIGLRIMNIVKLSKMNYLVKYKYLIGQYTVTFSDNNLILKSEDCEIVFNLKSSNIIKADECIVLEDLDEFRLVIPINTLDNKEEFISALKLCKGEY